MRPGEIFTHWRQVRAGLYLTIEQFNEDELHYKPYEGSWSVGKILLHIANAEDGWFRHVVTRELETWPKGHTVENYPTFKRIKTLLKEDHDWTERTIAKIDGEDYDKVIEAPWEEKFPLSWILWHVLEHEIHHRGELSLILGMLGREGLDV